MSGKSAKLNRDFDRKIMADAKKIADKYEIVLTEEDGQWYGRGLEMPAVFGEGETPDKCIRDTREAMVAAVAHLLETDSTVPAPASDRKRTEQVNVRLTVEEKLILNASARSQGFKGLGDFLRSTALKPQSN